MAMAESEVESYEVAAGAVPGFGSGVGLVGESPSDLKGTLQFAARLHARLFFQKPNLIVLHPMHEGAVSEILEQLGQELPGCDIMFDEEIGEMYAVFAVYKTAGRKPDTG